MNWLLDTHLLIWVLGVSPDRHDRLPRPALEIIVDPDNRLLFSAVAVLEVAIKSAGGRADFPVGAAAFRSRLLDGGYEELPVTGRHAVAVADLPPIHKDPFDRLLIAQATVERITLLTADAVIARYPGPIRKV